MPATDKVNILLVDDQPAKLLSYETILHELDENLLMANSAQEAFEHLLRTDVAVVLVDVVMPDLDGFQLAKMIREHPRFQQTAIIFISAVLLNDLDFLRGYELGAVDYVSVPVVPEILRAKVRVFAELYRKTQQLEQLNRHLERRVAERTAELEESMDALRNSEERLRLAFEAARMGWWDYDIAADRVSWSPSLTRIMGFAPESFGSTLAGAAAHVHPDDREKFMALVNQGIGADGTQTCELRFIRADGSVRWSLAAGQVIRNAAGAPLRFAGVDLDITERKHAEERQDVLVRELDHRAKNLLAVVQSVLRLSKADTVREFVAALEGRIWALSRAHTLLSESRWHAVDLGRIVAEEIAPFASPQGRQVEASGPAVSLLPATAQSLALALHELVTNAVKHGGLSVPDGRVALTWRLEPGGLVVSWIESGGPPTAPPTRRGFGTKLIDASVEHQLRGNAAFEWRETGLHCTISIPLSNLDLPQGAGEPEAAADGNGGAGPTFPIAASRVLLVEDEALIAMMMVDALQDLGLEVVGPFRTVPQALAAARNERLDGAILDVNVAGQQVYPVADLLAARRIPFVFLTGYSIGGIDRRYADVPVLEKPVESKLLRQLFLIGMKAGVADGGGASASLGG
jgi:PAS domain S-box-containing protein